MAPSERSSKVEFRSGMLIRTRLPASNPRAIANAPEVALTELVANAWDAGATEVKIIVPEDVDEYLTIEDDGTGMSERHFGKNG